MENQAPYHRPHVSECPLPELPETAAAAASYVVAGPARDSADELADAAAALVADAGLPAHHLSSSVSRNREGSKTYSVLGYDACPDRNPLDVCTAYGLGCTVEDTLGRFSAQLHAWARTQGLLRMEGSPVNA